MNAALSAGQDSLDWTVLSIILVKDAFHNTATLCGSRHCHVYHLRHQQMHGFGDFGGVVLAAWVA